MKGQTAAVLRLLQERPSGITPFDALEIVGSMRLGARIWDLRQAGYAIESEIVTVGRGKRVARYRLALPRQLEVGL